MINGYHAKDISALIYWTAMVYDSKLNLHPIGYSLLNSLDDAKKEPVCISFLTGFQLYQVEYLLIP